MGTLSGLIVGLGNPGVKYEDTRHNLGFILVDALLHQARQNNCLIGKETKKFNCLFWKIELQNSGTWLIAKPQTFMNESGKSVQPLAAWYKISTDKILIAHDEMDLPLGRMRFKYGGGNAGHNGLTSISRHLGTANFNRLRLGIGHPPDTRDTIDWVLGNLTKIEQDALLYILPAAINVVYEFGANGLEAAKNLAGGFRMP